MPYDPHWSENGHTTMPPREWTGDTRTTIVTGNRTRTTTYHHQTRTYSVEEVLTAECTLEPMECKFCHSQEVIFHQYIGDASCQDCGRWQLTGEF